MNLVKKLLAAALAICSGLAHAQTPPAQGPFSTPQINTTLYMGAVTGFYATIQSAVTKGCSLTVGSRVNIIFGSVPPDTIGAVTGGCTKAPIRDERVTPAVDYTWNGSAYVAVSVVGGVSSFNTRTGAVTLQTADVTALGDLSNNTIGTASNLSGTPALPNGTTATTQATTDNSTKIATTAYVKSLPPFCAGAACPNGSQVSVPFTTSAGLTLSANIVAADTTIPVISTTGFPTVGCASMLNIAQEYFCYNGTDATHLLNATRGIYGTSAQNWSSGAAIKGIVNSQAIALSLAPASLVFNDGSTQFPGFVGLSNTQIATGNILNGTITTQLEFRALGIATSSANFGSSFEDWWANTWNGSTSIQDTLSTKVVPGAGINPRLTMTYGHSGGTGPGVWQWQYFQLLNGSMTCDSTARHMIGAIDGGTGVGDILQACEKDSSNAYAWRPLYPTATGLPTATAAGQAPVSTGAGTVYTAQTLAASALTDTTNASNITSGTLAAVRLPASGVTAGTRSSVTETVDATGRVTALSGINYPVFALWSAGDSYNACWGSTNITNCGFNKLLNDTPVVNSSISNNIAIGGTTAPNTAFVVHGGFTPNATFPQALVINDGNNDYNSDTCGKVAGTNCTSNYHLAFAASVGFVAVPTQQRTLASNATATGTWTAYTTVPMNVLNGATAGTGRTSTVSGSTLTFTIPSTNNGHISLTQVVTNGGTGTFTVTINGVAQTSNCLGGTTSFSSGPCGGQPLFGATGNASPFRHEFFNAAWAGNTVTMVVATTNANASPILYDDYATSTLPANANEVLVRNTGASFDINGIYSAENFAVADQLRNDGYLVGKSDIRAALLALPNSGLNVTPVTVPYNSAGSVLGLHPSDAGQLAMYLADLAAENTLGSVFSAPGAGSSSAVSQLASPFCNANIGGNSAANSCLGTFSQLNSWQLNNPVIGALYASGSTFGGAIFGQGTMPDGTGTQYYTGFSGSFPTFDHVCFPVPTSNNFNLFASFNPQVCIVLSSGAIFAKQFNPTATQTTVSCSTSGNAVFSQPFAGTTNKKIVIQQNACLGTASYTFPTAFVVAPSGYGSLLSTITTVSTTAVTITGATSTGSVMLEAY